LGGRSTERGNVLTFFKWYQEWLIDCDYEPSQQQKEAMEDAWNGAMLTANEAAQQSVRRLTCFPQCKGCEYNPCDLANNSDYCPARR